MVHRILSIIVHHFFFCRYSREEPFTALNVDVRHHDNLYESLDAFVKGDLLEGANAYHCDKCDKKVSVCLSAHYCSEHIFYIMHTIPVD